MSAKERCSPLKGLHSVHWKERLVVQAIRTISAVSCTLYRGARFIFLCEGSASSLYQLELSTVKRRMRKVDTTHVAVAVAKQAGKNSVSGQRNTLIVRHCFCHVPVSHQAGSCCRSFPGQHLMVRYILHIELRSWHI